MQQTKQRLRIVALAVLIALAFVATGLAAPLVIPAHTAYIEPNPSAARVAPGRGVRGWRGRDAHVNWFGNIRSTGALKAAVRVRLAGGRSSKLRLTLDDVSREATARGGDGGIVNVDFGEWEVERQGYRRFRLESLNGDGAPNGEPEALLLDGPAAENAHFNLKPRRNAASVHLAYPIPKDRNVALFYCEMNAVDDPVHSYYMACGWHRGYFGMQVNSETERRIIFSVWDSGKEPVDRNKVSDENRVKLMGRGEDVIAKDFGNEGTGGHSHLKYRWKTGERQRFVVTAEPVDGSFTIFSGYYFHPGKKAWMLISSWRAPKDGGWLRGLYSFSENFVGRNGQLRRKALYGNQWIRDDGGEWRELTVAKFSHDGTGREDRLDRFMGLEGDRFFLSHGGFVPGFTQFGETFKRPAKGVPPMVELPGR